MRFLGTVFRVGENHRMFQEDILRWKCFAPHPFWEGSRGYALRYKDEIAAFGCVIPCRFLTGSAVVASCDVIDWAASKTVPGAGIMLYRHIQGLAGTMMNIGGTQDARSVLPKIGFRIQTERKIYKRVLRPWRHFQAAEQKDWKSPLRLARDFQESGRRERLGAMSARRVEDLDRMPAELFPDPAITQQFVCARTHELFRYFLACPAARCEAYLLERGQQPLGYFLLSRVGTQCRIADLWVRSADVQDWADAYGAASASAGADTRTTEVAVAVSAALQTAAIEAAGFRHTDGEPVFILDPEARLKGAQDLSLGFFENDGAYWSRV